MTGTATTPPPPPWAPASRIWPTACPCREAHWTSAPHPAAAPRSPAGSPSPSGSHCQLIRERQPDGPRFGILGFEHESLGASHWTSFGPHSRTTVLVPPQRISAIRLWPPITAATCALVPTSA